MQALESQRRARLLSISARKRSRLVYLVTLLLIAIGPAAHFAAAQSRQVQNWTTEDGLPQNSVHALLQSEDGYLWLATESGAARFDGLRFQRYSSANEAAFTSNDLCCIAQSPDGTLLFGSSNGLVALRDGAFQPVPGAPGQVLSLQRAADGVIVLTASALLRFHDGSVQPLSIPGGRLPGVLGRGSGGTVLAIAGTSLFRLHGSTSQALGNLPAPALQIAEDDARQLWTATASDVTLRGPRLEELRRWTVGAQLPGTRIESLRLWPGGALVGTNRGAAILSPRETVATPIDAIDNKAVLSAEIDREGDLWIGTDSNGLFAVRDRFIASAPALAGESVTAVAASGDGSVWVGTRDAGLRHVDGFGGELHTGAPAAHAPAVGGTILSVAVAGRDTVWVGSPEGLDRLSGNRVQHITAADGLPDDFIRSLAIAPRETVWAGTRQGAAQLVDGRVGRVLTVDEGLPSNSIGAMLAARDGTLWIGTAAGLARWDGTALHRVGATSPAALAITALAQDERSLLWVGTSHGLFVAKNDRLLPLETAGLQQSIAAILVEGSSIWLRTASGLLRASAADLATCAAAPHCDVAIRQFGVADGMPGLELPPFGYPMAARTRDGALWFATRRGVAIVDPGHSAPSAIPPGVAIEDVQVDGRTISLSPENNREVRVNAGSRRLAITFAGLSLRAPSQVRLRYLLQGFDRTWSAWQANTSAEYTNLPPGHYTLHVQAKSAEGALSTDDATLAVRVEAPLFRRWWFYLLLAGLAVALGYAIYWLRLRRVRQSYEAVLQERNRIAREIHDTLAQDFVAVSLQLEVTSQLLKMGAADAAREQIDNTRTLVRDGIQDARESIWAIRAGGASETLPARLAAACQRVPISRFLVTGAYRTLPPSREREIFRIGKEALGNAERHAAASTIRMELIYSEDAVVLRVSDDGAGFDVAAGSSRVGHYGLGGMRERAAAMGATLSVESTLGQGTCIELRLKA